MCLFADISIYIYTFLIFAFYISVWRNSGLSSPWRASWSHSRKHQYIIHAVQRMFDIMLPALGNGCGMLTETSELSFFFRNSHQRFSIKIGVLKTFAKFTGKHLCHSLFFNKVAGLGPATVLEKSLWHRCFPVSIAKFLRTPFLAEHLAAASVSCKFVNICYLFSYR